MKQVDALDEDVDEGRTVRVVGAVTTHCGDLRADLALRNDRLASKSGLEQLGKERRNFLVV
jgi:hypothetical protein